MGWYEAAQKWRGIGIGSAGAQGSCMPFGHANADMLSGGSCLAPGPRFMAVVVQSSAGGGSCGGSKALHRAAARLACRGRLTAGAARLQTASSTEAVGLSRFRAMAELGVRHLPQPSSPGTWPLVCSRGRSKGGAWSKAFVPQLPSLLTPAAVLLGGGPCCMFSAVAIATATGEGRLLFQGHLQEKAGCLQTPAADIQNVVQAVNSA